MKPFTLFAANGRELEKNTFYPVKKTIGQLSDLLDAVKNDCIAPLMEDNRRSNDNFMSADGIMFDVDNTHSEDPDDWLSIDDVSDRLPGVMFYYSHSRNHMRMKRKTLKDGSERIFEARPKYHCFAPLSRLIASKAEYENILLSLVSLIPYIDIAAAKPAQMFFGVKDPTGGTIDGEICIDEYLNSLDKSQLIQSVKSFHTKVKEGSYKNDDESQKALSQLFVFLGLSAPKKYEKSNTDSESEWILAAEQQNSIDWLEAWAELYDVKLGDRYRFSNKNHPNAWAFCVTCPWENEHSSDGAYNQAVVIVDLDGKLNYLCRHSHGHRLHWSDYRKHYENKAAEEGRLPELMKKGKEKTLLPLQLPEFSDVMQSALLVQEYGARLRYAPETGYLVYTGKKWELSELKAQKFSQRLTDRQLRDARSMLNKARGRLDKIEEATARGETDPDFYNAKGEEKAAKEYRKQVVSRRNTARIKATLAEAAPRVEIDIADLDADRMLLNTPSGAVYLPSGKVHPNRPEDYCTKITGVSPSNAGAELFETFLDQITCNDDDLKRYLQEVAGVFATGVVKREELYIATGSGGNGKSTFFNLLSKVMGDYAGQIASDVLIVDNRRNASPELAELRGKRLVISAELKEGCSLDSSMVKKLASTDPVRAESKFKDPFSFIPSHSLVLYTNHLPKVGARDAGTWDRLVLIPFNARFRGTEGEIKDYAECLFNECGGYVLQWMIEGAYKYIKNDYMIEKPEVVRAAIAEYQQNNNWLQAFLDECCIVGKQEKVFSGELYRVYREYCSSIGDFPLHNSDFNAALENAGFYRRKTNNGKVFAGLRPKTSDEIQRDIKTAERYA